MSSSQQPTISSVDSNLRSISIDHSDTLQWFQIPHPSIRLSGFPWFEVDQCFRRLPLSSYATLEKVNPHLNTLATHTSGGQISFITNSTTLSLKATIGPAIHMSHMAHIGQSSFDCYVSNLNGDLKFVSSATFDIHSNTIQTTFYNQYPSYSRQVIINFPLYGSVNSIEIGLDSDALLTLPPSYTFPSPIIFYGTSITQGGCASRPGLSYTNRLSRLLNTECVNLGFSGNGLGESEVAHLIATFPHSSCVVLDYEANAGRNGKLEKTLLPFIHILKTQHPDLPILLISRIAHLKDGIDTPYSTEHKRLRDFQQDTLTQLTAEGYSNLYFLDGSHLLGEDFDECTVDSIHPTDLGFYRMAEGIYPTLLSILQS